MLFFAVLLSALQSIVEINTLYAQRPIVAKHKSYAFYHPFTEAVAGIVADLPIKFCIATGFNVILYFLGGLLPKPSQFFIFFLFNYVAMLTMSAIFRCTAAVTKTISAALAIAGIMVLWIVVSLSLSQHSCPEKTGVSVSKPGKQQLQSCPCLHLPSQLPQALCVPVHLKLFCWVDSLSSIYRMSSGAILVARAVAHVSVRRDNGPWFPSLSLPQHISSNNPTSSSAMLEKFADVYRSIPVSRYKDRICIPGSRWFASKNTDYQS